MKRETVNLIFTVCTPIVCAVAAAAFLYKLDSVKSDVNAHADGNTAQLRQEMTANYETKDAHAADIQAVKDWNKTISTKVDADHEQTMTALNQHSLALQALTDAVQSQSQQHTTTTTTTTHQ